MAVAIAIAISVAVGGGVAGVAGAATPVAGGAAAPASPRLVSTRPDEATTLRRTPTRVTLKFAAAVAVGEARLAVLDGRGRRVAAVGLPFHPGATPTKLALRLVGVLDPGTYVVTYRLGAGGAAGAAGAGGRRAAAGTRRGTAVTAAAVGFSIGRAGPVSSARVRRLLAQAAAAAAGSAAARERPGRRASDRAVGGVGGRGAGFVVFMVALGGLVAALALWALRLAVRRPAAAGMPTLSQQQPSSPAARAQRAGQIALGVIWLADGLLQLQPYMFTDSLVTQILSPVAAGQPGVIAHSLTLVSGWIEPVVVPFNALAALTQIAIGVGLLRRRWLRAALVGSFAWSLAVWWLGEGFGGLLAGGGSPLTGAPGAVALYALAGVLVWPGEPGEPAESGEPAEPGESSRRAERSARPEQRRSAAAGGLLGDRGAILAWAGLWLLFAGLWLLPDNRAPQSVHDALADASTGIGGLDALVHLIGRATSGHGGLIAMVAAVMSVLVAVGPLVPRMRRPALVTGIGMAALFWVGQGFGGLFTGSATDPNSGPLLILIACLLLPLASDGTARPQAAGGSDVPRRRRRPVPRAGLLGPSVLRRSDRSVWSPASPFSHAHEQDVRWCADARNIHRRLGDGFAVSGRVGLAGD
jgi:methionine-rich copper-binding protein CopC